MKELIYYYPVGHAAHYESGHPERPERVEVIRTGLQKRGWWDGFPQAHPIQLPEDILQAVHSIDYLNLLEITSRRGGHLDADTYVTPASWQLAMATAGGASATAQAVWQGLSHRGFALTRPPGHHAMRGQGMGFCLLNNIAIAAEYLIQMQAAKRLAIVDIDLHHGNGTQDIFYNRGDVFYISLHQSPLYPGTGRLDEIGKGTGEGLNANFPLPPGSGDNAYLTIMEELILPLLNRYQPEMILISYGFDAHWSDPLGYLLLTADGYQRLVSHLINWADQNCQGRIVMFLEGGYNLDAGVACSLGVVAALLGENEGDPLGKPPYPEGELWHGILARAHGLLGI